MPDINLRDIHRVLEEICGQLYGLAKSSRKTELVMCRDCRLALPFVMEGRSCSAYCRCGRGLHVTADGKFPERNLEHDGCGEGVPNG